MRGVAMGEVEKSGVRRTVNGKSAKAGFFGKVRLRACKFGIMPLS